MRSGTFLIFFIPLSAFAAMTGTPDTPSVVVVSPKKHLRAGPGTIISRDQLIHAGVTTLPQALTYLGGVQLHDTSGNGSQVLLSMRGFGANASSNTLILMNGIPITHPDLAPPNLNIIPLQEIEFIEIIAGTESVTYGDQAVGGIVNIITRDQVKEKLLLSCSTGSYQQHHCYATWFQAHDPFKLHITAANLHSENYRDHNDYDQSQLSGQFAYFYQKGRIRFNYMLANEDMQYPGALTAAQVRQNRRQSANDTDFFKDNHYFLHLQHQHNLNADWTLLTDLANRDMKGHGVLTVPFKQARSFSFLKPEIKGRWGIVAIKSGIEAEVDDYQLNSSFGLTRDSLQKYGAFARGDIPFATRYKLSLGARLAQQNNHLDTLSDNHQINRATATTLGIAHQFTESITGYLRRAESFRFPKADELASSTTSVNSLRTQRGAAYETGVKMNRETNSFNVGLYQLNLKDEIAFDPTQTPQNPFGSNRNLSPTARHGFTVSAKNQVASKITLDAQYNYVNARFRNGVNAHHRIPLVSEHILHAGVNYCISDHWNLYPEFIFTGNQFAANDDANVAGPLGGYSIYNINLRYEHKQLTASLRINNIFNKYYYFYTVYTPLLQMESFYPAPERNVTLTVNYAFA